ncbi:MAG: GNAT family N-acetyltransferase [Aquincola sp.]|nr:GNAT family N-acetyltransferase [Aquincola sp.]
MASTDALPTIELGLPGWCLRAWRASDAPSLARHADNVNVWRWMSDSFPHPYTLPIAEHWVTRGHIDFGGENWAIACDDEAVGGCGIHPGAGQFRCNAEVGWWLAESHWGRGIGTRVAALLAARAFADPQITRVFAPVHAGNLRSMRVAEASGFVLEGVQPKSAIKDGRVVDRWIWATYRS